MGVICLRGVAVIVNGIERFLNGLTAGVLSAIAYFAVSFFLVRFGVLLAVFDAFESAAYWIGLVVIFSSSVFAGCYWGLGALTRKVVMINDRILGGGLCAKCKTPFNKDSVQCIKCGELVN